MTDSTITLATTAANRKEIAEAFGGNQSAVRRIEDLTKDVTVNLPNAISTADNSEDVQFLNVLVAGMVPAKMPRDTALIMLAMDSAMRLAPSQDGFRARMEAASVVSQAIGSYQASISNAFSKASTTGTSLTSGAPANAVSLPLAAGTWDISGMIVFNSASTTVIESITSGVSTTSATLGTPDTYESIPFTLVGSAAFNLAAPLTRVVLASAATVYLVAESVFTTSTMTADGYIQARPVH